MISRPPFNRGLQHFRKLGDPFTEECSDLVGLETKEAMDEGAVSTNCAIKILIGEIYASLICIMYYTCTVVC